jgi:hypothetical protein
MEARFDILPEDVTAFKAYMRKHGPFSSRVGFLVLLIYLLCQLALVPAVVLPSVESLFSRPAADGFPIVLLLHVGLCVCWFGLVVVAIWQGSNPIVPKGHGKNITMAIAKEWLSYSNAMAQTKRRWEDIDKIAVTDDHAFFFTGSGNVCILPCRAFASTVEFLQFVNTARTYHAGGEPETDGRMTIHSTGIQPGD